MSAPLDESLLREARTRYEAGETQEAIALALGVTKNTIAGYVARRGWLSPNTAGERDIVVPTLLDRMNALEAMFVEVLRRYPRGTGLLPPPVPAPRKPRAKDWAHR